MTVGVLIVSHEQVGYALLETAAATLGFCPLTCKVLPISRECDPDERIREAKILIGQIDKGKGVLVLTDMYGSTPSNIACTLQKQPNVRVVSGVNLPMLIRILNYPKLGLKEMVAKAVSGGREGIMDCSAISE